jgi:hypothetical protein
VEPAAEAPLRDTAAGAAAAGNAGGWDEEAWAGRQRRAREAASAAAEAVALAETADRRAEELSAQLALALQQPGEGLAPTAELEAELEAEDKELLHALALAEQRIWKKQQPEPEQGEVGGMRLVSPAPAAARSCLHLASL